ncbi:MAG: hypothetical protein GX605_04340, partial [Chloroflexi bacterium]|nr:hypothetical protein [Chloroflexota bacterium]
MACGGLSRVVVLYSHTSQLARGEPEDFLAEESLKHCSEGIAEALDAAGYRVALLPVSDDVEQALRPYSPAEWGVFNL